MRMMICSLLSGSMDWPQRVINPVPYLITEWRGLPEKEDYTYEPVDVLAGYCPDFVRDYLKKSKSKLAEEHWLLYLREHRNLPSLGGVELGQGSGLDPVTEERYSGEGSIKKRQASPLDMSASGR